MFAKTEIYCIQWSCSYIKCSLKAREGIKHEYHISMCRIYTYTICTWWGADIDLTFTPTTQLLSWTVLVILTAGHILLSNTEPTQSVQAGRTLTSLQDFEE